MESTGVVELGLVYARNSVPVAGVQSKWAYSLRSTVEAGDASLAVRLRLPMACLIPSMVVVVVATGMLQCMR